MLTAVKGKKQSKVSDIPPSQYNPDGLEQFSPASYGVIDLTAYHNATDDLVLRAGLFNITDKKYWNLNDVDGKATNEEGLDRLAQPERNWSVRNCPEIICTFMSFKTTFVLSLSKGLNSGFMYCANHPSTSSE